MSGFTRRSILGATAGSIATGTAVYALTSESNATRVQVDSLTVSNQETSVSNPVDGLRLNVDGSVTWDSDKRPDKVVLRLEGRVQGKDSYSQVAAQDWRTDLTKNQTNDFSFSDVNLLDLPNLTAEDLTPSNIGDTVSRELELRLSLSVHHNGTQLESHAVTDTATVRVTRQQAQVDATIDASGNMTVLSG